MGVQRLAVPDRLAFPPRTTRGARRLGQKVEIAVLGFGGYRPPFPEPASSRRNRVCSARSLHAKAFFKPAVSGKGFYLVTNGSGTGASFNSIGQPTSLLAFDFLSVSVSGGSSDV